MNIPMMFPLEATTVVLLTNILRRGLDHISGSGLLSGIIAIGLDSPKSGSK